MFLEAVTFGPAVTGGWCDHCLLPSIVAQTVVGLSGDEEVARFETAQCVDCGRSTARQLSGVRTKVYFR